LRAQGLGVDRAGFDDAMAQQKAAARAAWKGSGARASEEVWFDIAEEKGATEFIGYSGHEGEGEVVALVKDGVRVDRAGAGDEIIVLTNQTPFYGESGGQIGDTGKINNDKGLEANVEDTSKPLGRLHAHRAVVRKGEIVVGDAVHLSVDVERRTRVRANHSATHLLHAALRNRLGTHVTQKGSLVAPDYFRFDYSHPKGLTREDIEALEAEVNRHIRENAPVGTRLMTPDDAVAAGALALFGEKYGDEVRVLSMGRNDGASYSVELCGGTHVSALGDIQLLKITSESAVAAGVRRIGALTGEAARRWLTDREDRLKETAASLESSPDEVPAACQPDRGAPRLGRELAEAKRRSPRRRH
jgi:alanyl-tRNA synthetase